jgi:uncharacterized membrane protein (DUF4010 family)
MKCFFTEQVVEPTMVAVAVAVIVYSHLTHHQQLVHKQLAELSEQEVPQETVVLVLVLQRQVVAQL